MNCTSENLISHIAEEMEKGIQAFKKQLSGLRAGRASPALLESIMVDAYGGRTPLSQMASISVPEPRMLSVQVWDASVVSAVDKAIRASSIGLNPVVEGALLRIPLPELTQERREEFLKTARSYGEEARVALRHVRRHGMEHLDILEKKEHLSEDRVHALKKEIQKATDHAISLVDAALETKEMEMKKL